jgi:hypothetical protein
LYRASWDIKEEKRNGEDSFLPLIKIPTTANTRPVDSKIFALGACEAHSHGVNRAKRWKVWCVSVVIVHQFQGSMTRLPQADPRSIADSRQSFVRIPMRCSMAIEVIPFFTNCAVVERVYSGRDSRTAGVSELRERLWFSRKDPGALSQEVFQNVLATVSRAQLAPLSSCLSPAEKCTNQSE